MYEPSIERIKSLNELGFFRNSLPHLAAIFGELARIESWDRPTLISEYNGMWTAKLASSDAHFRDGFSVTCDTPENALADLLIDVGKRYAKARSVFGIR